MFVLASVGTDHHPFDRFVDWVEGWKSDHADHQVFTQYGTTHRLPSAPAERWVQGHELASMMGSADAIVCHGGPSTIMEARRYGLLPIVIPRNPSLGEHVDEHQMRFADFMAEKNAILLARDEDQLAQHLDRVLEGDVSTETMLGDCAATHERIAAIVEGRVAAPAPRRRRLLSFGR